MKLRLDEINDLRDIQIRKKLDKSKVSEYAENLDLLPPIIVFGPENYLGDGFHRKAAAEKIGRLEIEAERLPGGQREAEDWAVTANAQRGLHLTKDERNAGIERLLAHDWTQQAIADAMGITQQTVTNIGNSLALRGKIEKKDGKGQRSRQKAVKPLPEDVVEAVNERGKPIITNSHLLVIAALPDDESREAVARAVVSGELTERETQAIATTVKTDGLEAGLAQAANAKSQRDIKKGMKAAVDADAGVAVAGALGPFLHLRSKFTPEQAAAGVEPEFRDYHAKEFAAISEWAAEFAEVLRDRRLKAV